MNLRIASEDFSQRRMAPSTRLLAREAQRKFRRKNILQSFKKFVELSRDVRCKVVIIYSPLPYLWSQLCTWNFSWHGCIDVGKCCEKDQPEFEPGTARSAVECSTTELLIRMVSNPCLTYFAYWLYARFLYFTCGSSASGGWWKTKLGIALLNIVLKTRLAILDWSLTSYHVDCCDDEGPDLWY